ncbi:hypothetical protein AAMO2058_000407600 [Amorphochlora amoebiformis]
MGTILAMSIAGPQQLALGGTDRTLYTVDARKWKTVNRIQSITKYEITSLRTSIHKLGAIYLTSLDHEVLMVDLMGKISKKSTGTHLSRQALRGDSRWIGIDIARSSFPDGGEDSTEDLVGVTDTGRAYVICGAERMSG